MKGILPKYFDSEWSFAQVRVPENTAICCFNDSNKLIGKFHILIQSVVGKDGNYYQADIDIKNGGECKIVKEMNFLEDDGI